MKNLILFLLLFSIIEIFAQKPELHFTFEGIGDNREFHNGKSKSQTIFGTLGFLEAGTSFDGHSLRAGISELYEFGSQLNFHHPRLILYYKFENEKNTFIMGSFPRRNAINFPLSMLADTLLVYRPLLEGLLGSKKWENGWQNAFVDWTGRQTETVRESFMAGSSGEVSRKQWFLQNYVLLNHLAHTSVRIPDQHIKDYFGFSILTGFRSPKTSQVSWYVKGGILGSLYRERSVSDGFTFRKSLELEATAQYRQFSLKTAFHTGDSQIFALGDPFYSFRNYNRTDLGWSFIRHKRVSGHFNWSFHTYAGGLDQSQQMSLIYSL